MSRRCARILVSAGLLLVVLACREKSPAEPAAAGTGGGGGGAPARTIVLVSIDTLRSDHLPAYGYEAGATPAIDALRRDAVLYERAYSHVPLTLASHASLFTGVLPPVHGVRDNSGYRLPAGPDLPTVAESLRAAGYATGAAVSSYALRAQTGIGRGFDLYDDTVELGEGGIGSQQRPGPATFAVAEKWLRGVAGGRAFLFLHLYEPHTPYAPPEPFASRFASAYDGEVAAADAVVGRLVALLRELGLYEEAAVVLLSDHGEGLGDHGEKEHGILLYREALQVPLLVKLPGESRAGETIAAPVQLIDVYPTLMQLAGLEPPADLPGRSLLASPRTESRRELYAETWYPRLHHGWSELRSLIAGRYHYLEGARRELFDLDVDPGETVDLAPEQSDLVARLSSELAATVGADEPAAPQAEDEETRRRLAALGYLSGSTTRAGTASATSDLPDPRSQLARLGDLEDAQRLLATRDAAGAEKALRRLVADNPGMVDAWDSLADSLEMQGRNEEALEARREAIVASGGAPEQALDAALLLFRMGRLDEAREHAEVATAAFPSVAYGVLTRIALAQGEIEEAERLARRAMEQRGTDPAPVLALGQVLEAKGDAAEVLELVARHEHEWAARSVPDPRLELLRARALYRLQRTREADAAVDRALVEVDRMLVRDPGDPAGYEYRIQAARLRGDEKTALAAMEEAYRRGALAPSWRPTLALAWASTGRAKDAIELVAGRSDPDSLYARAVALSEAGRETESLDAFHRLVESSPEDARAWEGLGTVELRRGEGRAALAALERSVALDAGSANAWNLLAVARLQTGHDVDGAIAAWQRALALAPSHWGALYNLGMVAADGGRTEVARQALDRFAREAPRDAYAKDIETVRGVLAGLPD